MVLNIFTAGKKEFEFRIIHYKAWEKDKRQGVKRVLAENGDDL